ncbi:MAG: acyltransferase family protein [Rubripirellula sp.]
MIGYRPEIDGLRAFAVVPVILFHLGLKWIPGGFIGVDVFFVISGFLITSIVKKELEQGAFSFRDFWARRIRRIFPAMILVTFVTLILSWFFTWWPDQQLVGKQALASLFSVANINFWLSTGDYWGNASEESPFLHTWSLSVEEQFYLILPLAMWLLFRVRAKWLTVGMAVAVVGSLAVFLWGAKHAPTATFFLLPARVWEFGTGCLLALSIDASSTKDSKLGLCASVGLCMVVLSYLFVQRLNAGLCVAVFGTALVIAFGQKGICNALLSSRPVVHIGKISYSLYLWHWPILLFAAPLGIDWPGITDKVFLVLVTYAFALATFHYVEKPTRRRDGIVPGILGCSGIAILMACVMASSVRLYENTRFFAVPKWITFDVDPTPGLTLSPALRCITVEQRPGNRSDAYRTNGVIVGNRNRTPDIVMLGDSHGKMWSEVVAAIAIEQGLTVAFFNVGGVSAFFPVPPATRRAVSPFSAAEFEVFCQTRYRCLKEWKPKLVVISDRWGSRPEQENSSSLLNFLEAQGSKVLLIEDPPTLAGINGNNVMQVLASQGFKPRKGHRHYVQFEREADKKRRDFVRDLAAAHGHVECLPVFDLFVDSGRALAVDGTNVLYLDQHHLVQAGARRIAPRLREKVLELLQD